jgi:hypothetical protein
MSVMILACKHLQHAVNIHWHSSTDLRACCNAAQLWNKYLGERRLACRGLKVTDPALERLCDTYERALVSNMEHNSNRASVFASNPWCTG